MKICNLFDMNVNTYYSVVESFFRYLPDGITETEDLHEADIYFVFAQCNYGEAVLNFPQAGLLGWHRHSLHLSHYEVLRDCLNTMHGKPRLIFMDAFGVSAPDNVYPDYVKDTDIPIATVPLPPHPNALVTQFIDPKRFYLMHRLERRPKSAVVLNDHFGGNAHIFMHLFDKGLIDSLLVLRGHELPDMLLPYADKVAFKNLPWDSMCRELNSIDYTFQFRLDCGMEMMGVEGGFSGAVPIYPDTPYYRDTFGNDLGVVFFDPQNAKEDLIKALSVENLGKAWRGTYYDDFVARFNGEVHLPVFWNKVRQIVLGGKDNVKCSCKEGSH